MAYYLVQFGRSAFVGRLQTDQPIGRGDRLIIRTPRGEEFGSVLCETDERLGQQIETSTELIRLATEADERLQASQKQISQAIIEAASDFAQHQQLPITFLDVELLHDGGAAVLHGIAVGACDASELFAHLSRQFQLTVQLLDIARSPAVPLGTDFKATCGKPDCGEGNCSTSGGGCSSGTCSRGQVKSAEELSTYFLDLRNRMEADSQRHPLC